MKSKAALMILSLLSPVSVWAHAGHVDVFKLAHPGHFQLFEAMLVAALLMFIVLSNNIDSTVKKVKSRFKKYQSRNK